MPTNFVPSFTREAWSLLKENSPSSAFKALVNQNTMLWNDLRPCLSEDVDQKVKNQGFQPALKPINTEVGGMITIKEATGIPLPQLSSGAAAFKDEFIVKRALRCIVETAKNKNNKVFVGNSI